MATSAKPPGLAAVASARRDEPMKSGVRSELVDDGHDHNDPRDQIENEWNVAKHLLRGRLSPKASSGPPAHESQKSDDAKHGERDRQPQEMRIERRTGSRIQGVRGIRQRRRRPGQRK